MVIKGTSCAGARRLAVHLTREDTNERVEVKEIRGVAAEDLRGALLEMEAVGAGVRAKKIFYHGSINTGLDERLTDDQRTYAIDKLEAQLGLTGQPRIVVVHEKKDREHCHIVWSRIDLERMAVISDSHNFRKHEQIARDLEREFGHERVQGVHVEREGTERPKRTPSHAEMLQAERTGMSPKEAKEKITALWRSTDSGQAFANALDQNGWVLARGDRRDFVVIDPRGGTHSLARRIEGANAKDVRERMADLDAGRLPTVAEAKTIQRNRQARDAERGDPVARERARQAPAEATQGAPGPTPHAKRQPGDARDRSAGSQAADGVGKAAGAMFDGIASIFERGLSGENDAQPDLEKNAEPPPPDPRDAQHEESVKADDDAKKHLRQALIREFGRELGNERDADAERDRERERRGR